MNPSPYLQYLQNNREDLQITIDGLLEKYRVQPGGGGYIDLIIEDKEPISFIDELTGISVAVERLTWWCNCTPETESKYGCPHGMGGPGKRFGEGYFSECDQYFDFAVTELPNPPDEFSMQPDVLAETYNELVVNYIQNVLPSEPFYRPCLCIGLWLYVPMDWERKYE